MTTNKVSDDLRIFDDQYVEFGGDTSTPGDFQLGYNTGTNKLSLRDAALNIGFTFTDQGATFDMDLTGDFNLAGDLSLGAASSILSAAASVDIVNATPTTVNFAGAAGNINMGKVLSEFVFGSTASRTERVGPTLLTVSGSEVRKARPYCFLRTGVCGGLPGRGWRFSLSVRRT